MTNTSFIIIVPFIRPDDINIDFYPELDFTMLSSQDPEAYHELLERDLLNRRIGKPGSIPRHLAYFYGKELQSREDNKWIKQRNYHEPLHPILALYEDRNPIRKKSIKSRNHTKQPPIPKKGFMLGRH